MLKKVIVSFLALGLCAMMTSCGGNTDETADSNSAPADNESSVSEETSSDDTDTAESKPEVSYDFTGIDSEKAIKLLTSDKYHLIFSTDVAGVSMQQELYYNKNGILVNVDFMDTKYSTLYKDNVQYTMIDDIYYKIPVEDAEDIGSVDMFEDYGYLSTGETELDGKKYKYDEFYQGITDSTSKFLLDESNELYAIQTGETVMYVKALDSDFDDSAVAVPAGSKEVSEEEFNTSFLEKVAGGISDESTEESSVAE